MARPIKEGLDYFPLDVDIDQNDKIGIIEALHGVGGFGVVIKLLMRIYKEGYFYEWNKREQILFAKRINVDINTINEIVNDCINENLFNKTIYENMKTLTSKGIQKRYLEAAKRRKELEFRKELFLLDHIIVKNIVGANKVKVFLLDDNNNRINVDINMINDNNSTQRKEKERKEKERKEKDNTLQADNKLDEAWEFYYKNFGVASPYIIDDMNQYMDEFGDGLVIEALKRAAKENKAKWSYAEGILKKWRQRGVKSLEDVEGLDSEFKNEQEQRQQRSNYGNRQPARTEKLPDWFEAVEVTQTENKEMSRETFLIKLLELNLKLGKSNESIIKDLEKNEFSLTVDEIEKVRSGEETTGETIKRKLLNKL